MRDRPFRRDLCESAKRGQLCIDDLCHTGGETLCGFCQIDYDDMVDDEWDDCICDISDEDSCPVHYPIDDGSDDLLWDCGTCDSCIARTRAHFAILREKAKRENQALAMVVAKVRAGAQKGVD